MTPEKKIELLSKIPISGEIIDKAIELGYLGLNDLEKDALKPWMTFLIQKEEGKCGPLYIETSITTTNWFTKEDQVVSFNYQNSLREKPVDSEGNSNGYYASWFSFTIGKATARRMKLPYKKI